MDWIKILARHPQGNKILLAYASVGRSPVYTIGLFRSRMWMRCIIAIFKPVVNLVEMNRSLVKDNPKMESPARMEMLNDIFHYKHGIIIDRSTDLEQFKQRLYVEGLHRGKRRNLLAERTLKPR